MKPLMGALCRVGVFMDSVVKTMPIQIAAQRSLAKQSSLPPYDSHAHETSFKFSRQKEEEEELRSDDKMCRNSRRRTPWIFQNIL